MSRFTFITPAVLVFFLFAIFSCPASAQPSSVEFYSVGPFTTDCGGTGDLLSPDTPVFIYWDRDHNGPDSLDGHICLYIQMCFPEDPRTNLYMFYMNIQGAFVSPEVLIEGLGTAEQLYLRIFFGANDDSCYTSSPITIVPGIQEITLPIADWSCGPALGARPRCQTEESIEFAYQELPPYQECFETCRNGITEVNVDSRIGQVTICRPPVIVVLSGCEVPCNAATAKFEPSDWYRLSLIDWWCGGRIIGQARGCVDVTLLDSVPCARVDTFWAELLANEIVLHWTTSREEGCRYFEVWRPRWQGYLKHYVGTVAASGSASGWTYSLTDDSVSPPRWQYSYLLIACDNDSLRYAAMHIPEVLISNASENPITKPGSFALHPNYPNPFNAQTKITFEIPRASDMRLRVFNVLGREVTVLAEGMMSAGSHTVMFDGAEFSSGVYFYRMEAGEYRAVQKMVMMK